MEKFKTSNYLKLSLVAYFLLSLSGTALSNDLPYNYYPKGYDTLSQKDWPAMKETFNFFLSFKTTEEVINYSDLHKARYTLARMTEINWDTTKRIEVSAYLSYFMGQLIQGDSYLKIDSIIFPQYVSTYHPIYLPKNVIWALFLIDNGAACSKIKDIWEKASTLDENSYLVDLRSFTFWLFETGNNKTANEFFINNSIHIGGNLNPREIKRTELIRLKCEIALLNDQKQAWDYLWNNSHLDSSNVYTDNAQFFWYKNILMMENTYQKIDLKIILDIIKTTSSPVKEYIFLYTICFNINSQLSDNPDYKIDSSILEYLNTSFNNIKSQSRQSGPESKDVDFLRNTYDSMNANISKRATK